MAELKYPIGIQSFKEIREGGYVYVDKTEFIHRLVSTGKYYFLSRPRRFGKSLLISTIEEYFRGRRDLFEGLAIAGYAHDWEPHPVLHLDLSGCDGDSEDNVKDYLDNFLTAWERDYGLQSDRSVMAGLRFKEVIRKAHEQTGRNVVILIDEYDKPLLETVDRPDLQEKYRSQLRSFYSNLKSQDEHIGFAMLTGVTKFGHLSIFSDLNNLNDISLDDAFGGICGITKGELHGCLGEGVRSLAEYSGSSESEAYGRLREHYDGYHFSRLVDPDIYNPFSVLKCLFTRRFGGYWFSTGTPTFLIRMLMTGRPRLRNISGCRVSVSTLMDVPFDLSNMIPVLYQSGYLTIKGYDARFDKVTLDFPNKEVEEGFLNCLMESYVTSGGRESCFDISEFTHDVESGDVDGFMGRLQSLFADFQYDSFDLGHLEQHYQDVIFLVSKLMGFYTRTEYKTSTGRIDLVVKTPCYIYVFEFKVDGSAEDALRQIDSKDYMLPFAADGRRLIKVGVNFSSARRGIDRWVKETE